MKGFLVFFVGFFVLAVFSKTTSAHQCDAETECSEEETCCKLGDNLWGCCPMPSAVCCDDRAHCCPKGTTCDPKGARCVGGNDPDEFVPMRKKTPARKTVQRNQFNEIVCADKSSKCPDGSTCCLLETGAYGCCPVPNAVCCADMLHCCPNGFTCHGQFCSQNFAMIPHLKKFDSTPIHRKPAVEFLSEEEEEEGKEDSDESSEEETSPEDAAVDPIRCGIGKTCPAKATCCTVRSAEDGSDKQMCCPLSNAVCCQNTCCPTGYHCVAGGKCEKHAKAKRRRFWNEREQEEDKEKEEI